ncbi:MAG TPA: ABC transporter ATP-binding protein, partial [Armatimonadota bacterium]|nr:ABC transporter ATP-binding protein [Armatimonadota bacterium]
MNSVKRMFAYIFRYKLYIFASVFFSVLYAAMNAGSIYLLGPFLKTLFGTREISAPKPEAVSGFLGALKQKSQAAIDSYLGMDDPHTALTRLCVLIIVLIFFKNAFAYLQGYIIAFVEQGVVRDLRHDIYIAYHRLPLSFFQRRRTGDMLSRVINDCTVINDNFNSAFIEILKEPINIAFLLGVMLVISWKLTIFTFFISPPVLLIIARIAKKLRRRTTRSQDRVSELTSVLEETISNIRVVKAFAMEKFEIGKFDLANNSYLKSLIRLVRLRRLSPPVTEFLGVAAVVLVLWIGGSMVLDRRGNLHAEEFMQFIIFMFMLMQAAKRLSDVNVKLQVGIAATGRVFEIIDRKSEVANPEHPVPIRTVQKNVRFRNVWYEYESGTPVLRNIDLNIDAGEMVAIIGPSGGGKSTLMDLLPRFFDPTRGSVEIDGVDIR